MHVSRLDKDGNGLTIVSDATGRVYIGIEGGRHALTHVLESDQLVLVAYEMLRLVQEAEGADAVDDAIKALQPYADDAERQAHMADALWNLADSAYECSDAVPSVTTILGGALPKSALRNYSEPAEDQS